MKTLVYFLSAFFSFLFIQSSVLHSNNISGIINSYTKVLSINKNDTSVVVSSTDGFNTCDRVLIIQMKGADINTDNNPSFGAVTTYNNAGNYEILTIRSIVGNTIKFFGGFVRNYTPAGKVQLVTIPKYANINFVGTCTGKAWDGDIGGVFAVEATNTIRAAISYWCIDMDGKGFRGAEKSAGITNTVDQFGYYYSFPTWESALKGEGIAEVSDNMKAGRGRLANGGGAGNNHNAGGAGGSNWGQGGNGGHAWNKDLDPSLASQVGGIGGVPINIITSLNKVFLGGGGGAGHSNQSDNVSTAGANGGGIVLVIANDVDVEKFATSCGKSASTGGNDGSGGAGAGGTILLDIKNIIKATVQVDGGRGGDNNGMLKSNCLCGPGGGGGGGVVSVRKDHFQPLNVSIVGGAPGIITNTNVSYTFDKGYGATDGKSGLFYDNLIIPQSSYSLTSFVNIDLSVNTPICEGDIAFLNCILDKDSTLFTYEWIGPNGYKSNYLKNKIINTSLNNKGWYYFTANYCGFSFKDSIYLDIHQKPQVKILPEGVIICEGSSLVLYLDKTYKNYKWSTGEVSSSITINKAGTYSVTIHDEFGCTATDDIFIKVKKINPKLYTNGNILCHTDSVELGLVDSYVSYKWSTGATSSKIIVKASGTYSVTVTDKDGCTGVVSTVIIIANAPQPIIEITKGSATVCEGEEIEIQTTEEYTEYYWTTGQTTRKIIPKISGKYIVTVYDKNGCPGQAEIDITIFKIPEPKISIIGTYPFCEGDSIALQIANNYYSILWSTGDTTNKITIDKEGKYIVSVVDSNGCKGSTEIEVKYKEVIPEIVIVGNNPICLGDSITLKTKQEYKSYKWSTGDTTATIIVKQAGEYWVEVGDDQNCTGLSNMYKVVVNEIPIPEIIGPEYICKNATAEYSITKDNNTTVSWKVDNAIIKSGQWTNCITVEFPNIGIATIEVAEIDKTTNCMGYSKKIVHILDKLSPKILASSVSICEGSTVTLFLEDEYQEYKWSTGDTTKSIVVEKPGIYTVKVKDMYGCEGESEPIEIKLFTIPEPIIIGNTKLCYGESTVLSLNNKYKNYLWSTGDTTQSIVVNDSGVYEVTVTDSNNCINTTKIKVELLQVILDFNDSIIDMNEVLLEHLAEKTINIKNKSDLSINIKTCYLKGITNTYVVTTSSPLPISVQKNNDFSFIIAFNPQQLGINNDTLIIEIDTPCEEFIKIPITGIGIAKTMVWLPDTFGIIGTKNYKIPLKAKLSFEYSKQLLLSSKLKLEHNGCVYYVNTLIPNNLVDNTNTNCLQLLTVENPELYISQEEKTIVEMSGQLLFGFDDYTKLVIKDFSWNNEYVYIDTIDGSINTQSKCASDISHFRLFTPTALSILPNPVREKMEISATCGETGKYEILIYTIQGIEIKRIEFIGTKNKTYNYQIDIEEYSSGLYKGILKSPSQVISKAISIVK